MLQNQQMEHASQEKKSCSGPWVLTYRPWDLFHQTYSKTLNTFDGTDPKVDRLKPKVRNTIFFPVHTGLLGGVTFTGVASSGKCVGRRHFCCDEPPSFSLQE